MLLLRICAATRPGIMCKHVFVFCWGSACDVVLWVGTHGGGGRDCTLENLGTRSLTFSIDDREKDGSSHLGVEPRTFGLEVQRAIHCANGTPDTYWLYKIVLWLGCGPHCAIVVKQCSPFELVILIPGNVHEEGPKKTKILIARAGARTLDR